MARIYARTHSGHFAQVGSDALDARDLHEGLLRLRREGRLPHLRDILLREGDLTADEDRDLLAGGTRWVDDERRRRPGNYFRGESGDRSVARNLVNRCPSKGARGHKDPEAAAVKWLAFAYPTVDRQGDGGWYYRELNGQRVPLCQGKAALVEYARRVGGITTDAAGRWYALTSLPVSALALREDSGTARRSESQPTKKEGADA